MLNRVVYSLVHSKLFFLFILLYLVLCFSLILPFAAEFAYAYIYMVIKIELDKCMIIENDVNIQLHIVYIHALSRQCEAC